MLFSSHQLIISFSKSLQFGSPAPTDNPAPTKTTHLFFVIALINFGGIDGMDMRVSLEYAL